ncbi:hypothetical protein [Tepidibacter mesophilus]|uniref:hypothetical protein n=1 Tax=Tepidibacter mesophilus TaxID=655607 RepID=UPI000C08C30D|nr:hypothetical protein [Tepidibacter mesophilus]
MLCPNCSWGNLRKIGRNIYYCKNCFHEVEKKSNIIILFELDGDGTRKKVFTVNIETESEEAI